MKDTGITEVQWVTGMQGPATVDIKTGVLYLNLEEWPKIPENQRNFILLHEIGHRKTQSFDEIKADNFAAAAYKAMGLPLSAALKAHLNQLDKNNPEHVARANNLYNKLEASNNTNMRALETINEKHGYSANFLGLTKASRARIADRKEARREAKLARIETRQKGRAAQAAAGGGWATNLKDILGGALGGLGLGGGAAAMGNAPLPTEEKDNTMLYIGIAVVVIVVAYFLMKKKK